VPGGSGPPQHCTAVRCGRSVEAVHDGWAAAAWAQCAPGGAPGGGTPGAGRLWRGAGLATAWVEAIHAGRAAPACAPGGARLCRKARPRAGPGHRLSVGAVHVGQAAVGIHCAQGYPACVAAAAAWPLCPAVALGGAVAAVLPLGCTASRRRKRRPPRRCRSMWAQQAGSSASPDTPAAGDNKSGFFSKNAGYFCNLFLVLNLWV
jgi:hypothetical protein